jgi:hypothetical protein
MACPQNEACRRYEDNQHKSFLALPSADWMETATQDRMLFDWRYRSGPQMPREQHGDLQVKATQADTG